MKAKPGKHSDNVILEINPNDESMLTAASTSQFRVEKILVPTDFSTCSKKALQYAIPLAKLYGASIALLTVVPSMSYAAGGLGGIDYVPIELDMRSEAERNLGALTADTKLDIATAEKFVQTGAPGNEIVSFAKSLPADLIVISTQGHTGLKHALLGSVAEYVVRHAPCPVLVVREKEHEFLANLQSRAEV